VYATVAADEAVQLGGRAASGDGGFVALELLAYGTASIKRELRRARFAPGIDDVHHVQEGLFRREQWPQLALHGRRHDAGMTAAWL
jgi:hypothetical protein